MTQFEPIELGEFCKVDSGFAFKSEQFSVDCTDVFLVKGSNLSHRQIKWDEGPWWNVDDYEKFERYQLTEQDVLLAMDRPIVGGQLKYSWIKEGDPKALLVQRVARLSAVETEDQKFLRYVIASPAFLQYIDIITTGVNVPHISGPDIRKYKFNLPKKSARLKIAEILDAYDNLIDNNLKRIKLLEEMAQITYEEWFVHMKFPGHEAAVFDEKTGLPEGWEKSKLEDIAEFSNGYAFYTKGYSETGFDVIDLGNISKSSDLTITGHEKKVSEELYNTSKKFHLSKNDVVIAMTDMTKELGILAKSAIIDKDNTYVLNQRVGRLRSKVDYIDYSFIYALINEPRFIGTMHSMSKGAVQFYFNTKDIINYEVIIPAKSTVEAFQKQYKPYLEARQALKEQISLLKEAQGILLPRLMTGIIDIEQVILPEAMLKRLEQKEDEAAET